MGRKILDKFNLHWKIHKENKIKEYGLKRALEFRNQKREYGFDERELWDLDYSISTLLYERLVLFKEVAKQYINLEFHQYEYKGETLTQLQCIDRMIDSLEFRLTNGEPETEKDIEKMREVYEILALCFRQMWY